MTFETDDKVLLPDGRKGMIVDMHSEDEATALIDGEEEVIILAQVKKIS